MFNLDMVGRLSPDAKTKKNKLHSEGGGTAKAFKGLLDELVKKYDFHHIGKASGFGPSDHASFCGKKVPVLFFWTGYHDDYHMPSDTADKINVSTPIRTWPWGQTPTGRAILAAISSWRRCRMAVFRPSPTC